MGSDSWGKKSWVNTVYMQASPYRNRAQYTNSYLDELPVPPWFMIGPCGHLFNYALYLCLCEQQFSGTTIEQESGFVESTFNFSSFMPIDSITEEDVPDFIGFVYDLFSAYSMSYVIVDSGITIYDEERTFGDLYAQNPLSLASPDLTALAFTANASGYVWKLIQSVQKYTAYLAGDAETTIGNLWGFVAALPTYIDHFAFPRGGGVVQYKNQNRLIDPVSNATTHEQFRKQKIVKEFELGNLYYNTAIVRHFTPSPMHANDAIQITPEGHYSFNRRDLFEISKQFCTQDVKYYNDKLNYSGAGLYNFSTGAMPLILRYEPIPAQGLTASDVDWKLLEGLHWFYGEVKTTHLAVYNLAYQQVAPADRKPYLLSEEDYQSWYSAADFKPDFQFLSYNNDLWVYPGDAEDGQPITAIYRSLGSTHNTSTLLYPKFDGRSQRSSLRLSPLFFS
jgi:hypothetical protein